MAMHFLHGVFLVTFLRKVITQQQYERHHKQGIDGRIVLFPRFTELMCQLEKRTLSFLAGKMKKYHYTPCNFYLKIFQRNLITLDVIQTMLACNIDYK